MMASGAVTAAAPPCPPQRSITQSADPVRLALVVALCCCASHVMAQPYAVPNGETRHRFAQLEIGLTQYYSRNAGETQVLQGNTVRDVRFGSRSTTAIFIGGTHFWGHADFALTIPVFSAGQGMGYGVDLQAKYLPWRMEQNKMRPYIGVSMNPFGYSQNDGGQLAKTFFPLVAGLNFYRNNNQFELGAVYNYDNAFPYYVSRTRLGTARVQPVILSATYKYTLETTGGNERNWRNGTTARETRELAAAGKLNSFSVAIGPTSTFRLRSSRYLQNAFPFAGQHSWGVTLDYGVGYYWHKPDLHVNLAYRTFGSNVNAYGYSQGVHRKVTTFETFKYLFDYNGFVPFVGPNLSYEQLAVTEQDGTTPSATYAFKGFKPGLTFGWDIRPNRIQSVLLRTNLRWSPGLNVTMANGSKNALDQLEFNFIQAVIYPQRLFRK
jgi:hypothetical protein